MEASKVKPICATEHKPAVYSCKEIQKHIGLHWQEHKQQFEESDYSLLPGTVVRLYIQHCILFLIFPPQCKRNIHKRETVQQTSTGMFRGMEHISYKEKLRELGLFILKKIGSENI